MLVTICIQMNWNLSWQLVPIWGLKWTKELKKFLTVSKSCSETPACSHSYMHVFSLDHSPFVLLTRLKKRNRTNVVASRCALRSSRSMLCRHPDTRQREAVWLTQIYDVWQTAQGSVLRSQRREDWRFSIGATSSSADISWCVFPLWCNTGGIWSWHNIFAS